MKGEVIAVIVLEATAQVLEERDRIGLPIIRLDLDVAAGHRRAGLDGDHLHGRCAGLGHGKVTPRRQREAAPARFETVGVIQFEQDVAGLVFQPQRAVAPGRHLEGEVPDRGGVVARRVPMSVDLEAAERLAAGKQRRASARAETARIVGAVFGPVDDGDRLVVVLRELKLVGAFSPGVRDPEHVGAGRQQQAVGANWP